MKEEQVNELIKEAQQYISKEFTVGPNNKLNVPAGTYNFTKTGRHSTSEVVGEHKSISWSAVAEITDKKNGTKHNVALSLVLEILRKKK